MRGRQANFSTATQVGEAAARAYGHEYAEARDPASLADALSAARGHTGVTVVRAVVPPQDAAQRSRALYQAVDARLGGSPG